MVTRDSRRARRRHIDAPLAIIRADGTLAIRAPYVPLLPYYLRRDVPAAARHYNPATQTWTIAPRSTAAALRAFRAVFPDAPVVTPRGVT